jgi:hypothetical protein
LLTSALDGSDLPVSRPGRFTLCIHCKGSWVDSRAGLDAVARRKNPSPCQESNPRCPVLSLVTKLMELPRLTRLQGVEKGNNIVIICVTFLLYKAVGPMKVLRRYLHRENCRWPRELSQYNHRSCWDSNPLRWPLRLHQPIRLY